MTNKKRPTNGRKAGNTNSLQAAHVLAARRREVARYRARGWDISEIAERLGVAVKTISQDLEKIDAWWWQQTQRDNTTIVRHEAQLLETARQQVLDDYYDTAFQGQIHHPHYMRLYGTLTAQLHELLRLKDPSGQAAMSAPREQARTVEILVETREQAAAIQDDCLDFAALSSMAQQVSTDDEPPDPGTG